MDNNLLYGIQVTFIGMLVVFVGLIGLAYTMEILHKFFGIKENKAAKMTVASPPSPVIGKVVSEVDNNGSIPEEVIAIIAGAVTTYLNTAPECIRIRIVRQPQPTAFSAWGMAGRQEQMTLRQI